MAGSCFPGLSPKLAVDLGQDGHKCTLKSVGVDVEFSASVVECVRGTQGRTDGYCGLGQVGIGIFNACFKRQYFLNVTFI